MDSSRIIGIDLGTTNSAIAIIEGDDPDIIVNAEGKRTTPSIVAFDKAGVTIVGDVAKRQATTNVSRTFAEVKRHMGTDWSATVDERTLSAAQVSALILAKMKKDAEAFLGEEITRAIITVPAYFNDAERQATKDAGAIAGLTVERIINEPTAAALAYGLSGTSQKVLVYDLGGGTFDVSLLDIDSDAEGGSVEVLATTGDNELGGKDVNESLANLFAYEFNNEHGVDLMSDPAARARLIEAAENAKIELSSADTTQITLPYITMTEDGPLTFERELTREEFNEIITPLLERTRQPMLDVVAQAGLSMSDVDTVLLVGGSSRMPIVASLIEEVTGKQPNKTVNPDEIVAMGAALQGAIVRTGSVGGRDMVLVDRLALSFGVRAAGGRFVPVIDKGSTVPTRSSATFSTAEDGQDSVFVEIFQGDRPHVDDCKKLGDFELSGIPPAPAGVPQIQVTFDIDVNSNLTISARDLASKTEQTVTISGSQGMTPAEVERAVADAREHEAQDEKLRAEQAVVAQADRVIRQSTKTLSDFPDADAALRDKLSGLLDNLKKAKESGDIDAMKPLIDQSAQAAQELGASLYA